MFGQGTIGLRWPMVLAATLALAACYGSTPGEVTDETGTMSDKIGTAETELGLVLVDSAGMTLYTFDNDAPGKSNCNGQCAANWPPLKADAGAQPSGDLTIVVRDDGSRQWAIRDMPLYGWVRDEKPGDTTGEGVRDIWRVARP